MDVSPKTYIYVMTKTVLQKTVSLEKKPFWKERKRVEEKQMDVVLKGLYLSGGVSPHRKAFSKRI